MTFLENPWALSAAEAVERLESDSRRGLGRAQAKRLLASYGPNRLEARKLRPAWRILVSQFANFIIGLLAGAAAISLFYGQPTEAGAIGTAILVNAAIGFFTELRAARSMESLRKMDRVTARVVREGRVRDISAAKLVPGDILELEAGDVVAADLRLLEANRLEADESALTGESLPVAKDTGEAPPNAPLAERRGMLHKGTALTNGSARGVVTATGGATELGRIAQLTEEAAREEESPLQRRLALLGRRLVWLTLAVALAMAVSGWLAGRPLLLIVETAVALAVAAIPEGLPMVATIALARGMWRLARRHAVLRRLSAVETLGSTTVICTDKTGTLTANRMELAVLTLAGEDGPRRMETEGKIDTAAHPALGPALEVGVLCGNARLDEEGGDLGDPLEGALLRAGRRAGIEREALLRELPEEREEAFDPEQRMMATFHAEGGRYRVAIKGAPEAVLAAARRVWDRDGGRPLDDAGREVWMETNRRMAGEGHRVIALAQRQAVDPGEDPYQGLEFLGLAGLWDPPREEAARAIEDCRRAGIRVVMVTGDQEPTARFVGRRLGLASGKEGEVVSGRELDPAGELDEAARRRILGASILARVSPGQKLTLISLHQEAGHVVAMTGDGVNDAPALKKADIGVAMGQRGTQVAREAADMVLTDDALSSIVVAVGEGRTIFSNIRKFIVYLLSGNMAEILAVALAILADWPLPLLPLQILYLNMIGDVFPALALGVGRGGAGHLERPPRRPGEPVLTTGRWWGIMGWGGLIASLVLGSFGLARGVLDMPGDQAVTVSFLTLAFGRLWHVFNMRRPEEGIVKNEVTANPAVWGALALCTALLLAAEFVAPARDVLGMAPLPAQGWLLVAGGSLAPLAVGQTVLTLIRKTRRGPGRD